MITDNDKKQLILFIESLDENKSFTEAQKDFIIQYSYFVKYSKNMFYFTCPFKPMCDEGIFLANVTYYKRMHVKIFSDKNKEFFLNDKNYQDFIIYEKPFELLSCQEQEYIKTRDLYPNFEEKKFFGHVYTSSGCTWWNHVIVE